MSRCGIGDRILFENHCNIAPGIAYGEIKSSSGKVCAKEMNQLTVYQASWLVLGIVWHLLLTWWMFFGYHQTTKPEPGSRKQLSHIHPILMWFLFNSIFMNFNLIWHGLWFGVNYECFPNENTEWIVKKLAHLYAFFLSVTDASVVFIQHTIRK